jgi:gluconolactonase
MLSRGAEVLAVGLQVPEGPAVMADGTIAFTEQTAGRISILDHSGAVSEFAITGGSPNACIIGAAGELYVCQNGGIVGSWRSDNPITPSIQEIRDGNVTTLWTRIAGRELVAPNDLVFDSQGRLAFTDPAQGFNPDSRTEQGAIFRSDKGLGEVHDVGGVYCNGVAVNADDALIWVESYTRNVRILNLDDTTSTLCQLPEGHIPDGLCVAADGRLFIATCGSHGITVVTPTGEVDDFLYLGEQANPSNCCFCDDALIVTDFTTDFERHPASGRLWRVPVDTIGAPVHRWSL